jgi:hypothetical protein
MMRTYKNVFHLLNPSIVNIRTRKKIDNNANKPDITIKAKSDLNNIQIRINERTVHTPELGPSSVNTEREEPVIDTDMGSDNLQAGFNTYQRLFVDKQKPIFMYADIRNVRMVPRAQTKVCPLDRWQEGGLWRHWPDDGAL